MMEYLGRARTEQDDSCTAKTNDCANQVPTIGLCAFDQP